jgi:magnesium transporter
MFTNASACVPFKDTQTVSWICVEGVHDVGIVEKFGQAFDLHVLTQEDIVHTRQRPKMEDHDDYLFVVVKALRFNEEKRVVEDEQISFILGPSYVISFQEEAGVYFDAVRERIRNPKSRLRKFGADYLLYVLMDSIVDNYFVVLEKLEEWVEALQQDLVDNPTEKTLQEIYDLKQNMVLFRKTFWPTREMVNDLIRNETDLIQDSSEVYFRDVYDHVMRVIETTDMYREMIGGMLDVYLSIMSNRMNSVMKVLTIIATIFIPLTFVAGIYGMNFKYMPELDWPWGYPAIWCIMGVITVGMMIYFRKKRWL